MHNLVTMGSPQLPGLSDLTEVGRGGYGVVYRARQDRQRRHVAVKVLSTELDDGTARRFAQESRTLGAVSAHPHIVAVHEVGSTPGGEPYLVMPFCERGSLTKRIDEGGSVPWQEVLDIGVRLAGALQTAHDTGVLHRDIKPANILVDADGSPRLADFGQDPRSSGYCAPEVLKGASVSHRSDVYSLAATLLALIGVRQQGVPEPVSRVLAWGITKDPEARPASAGAFGAALQDVQRQSGLAVSELTLVDRSATPPPGQPEPEAGPILQLGGPRSAEVAAATKRRRIRWTVVAVVVALLVATGVTALVVSGSDDPAPVRPQAMLLRAEDYGVGGLRADSSLPSAFTALFGTPGETRATALAECLGLPVTAITTWQESPAYARGTPIGESASGPKEFGAAQSAGLRLAGEQDARSLVENLAGPRMGQCRQQLLDAGIGLVAGKKAPGIEAIAVSDLSTAPNLPGEVTFAGKRIDVPVRWDTGTVVHLFVDIQAMSSGSSVVMVVAEAFPDEPSDDQQDAITAAMARGLGH